MYDYDIVPGGNMSLQCLLGFAVNDYVENFLGLAVFFIAFYKLQDVCTQ